MPPKADAFLTEIDALIDGAGAGEATAPAAASTTDPVLSEVDRLLAPFEVTTGERQSTEKALEIGQWPGDDAALKKTLEQGGRKDFDKLKADRIPQVRQVHRARKEAELLKAFDAEQESLTHRASEFVRSIWDPTYTAEAPKPPKLEPDATPHAVYAEPPKTRPAPTDLTPDVQSPSPALSDQPPKTGQTDNAAPFPVPPAPATPTVPTQAPSGPVQSPEQNTLSGWVNEMAQRYGVRPALVRAIIMTESSGNPKALGRETPYGKAKGLMQLLDSTAAEMGVQDSFDPRQNIEGGTKYLAQLLKHYGGDETKAIAAYNFGMGNVDRGRTWPRETQSYVQKVKRLMSMDPETRRSPVVRTKSLAAPVHPFEQAGEPPAAPPESAPKKLGPLGTEIVGMTPEGRVIVKNPDGTVSTERTTTIQDPRINGGRWTNIPTMFGGKQVEDDEATDIIAEFGGLDPETGRQLEGFNSREEAEAAAETRSRTLDQYNPDRLPTKEDWLRAVPVTAKHPEHKGFLEGIVSGAKGGTKELQASALGSVERFTSGDPKQILGDWATQLEEVAKTHAPDTAIQKQPWYQRLIDPNYLGHVLGSTAVQSAPALAAALAGGSVAGLPGAVGAAGLTVYLQQAGSTYREAYKSFIEQGMAPETAEVRAYYASDLAGIVSAVVNSLAFPASLVEPFKKKLTNLVLQYGLNISVDVADQLTQNVIAQPYDPAREVLAGVPEAVVGSAALSAPETMVAAKAIATGPAAASQGVPDRPAQEPPQPTAPAPGPSSLPPPIAGVPPVEAPAPVQTPPPVQKKTRKRPAAVEQPAAIEQPTPVPTPTPIEQPLHETPAPVEQPEALTPEQLEDAMAYVEEYTPQERPAPVEASAPVEKPEVNNTPAEVKNPEAQPLQSPVDLPVQALESPVDRPAAETKPAPVETIPAKSETIRPEVLPAPPPNEPQEFEVEETKDGQILRDKWGWTDGDAEPAAAMPGEPLQTYGANLDEPDAVLVATDELEPHYQIIRSDGSVLVNPKTKKDVFDTPDEAKDEYARTIDVQGGAVPPPALPAPLPAELAPIDVAANEAATSPTNDLDEPSEGQKEVGNYKKGHRWINGLNISIENPQGSTRSGTDKSGKPWSVEMKSHYGYIRGTKGKDKDHIDVFVKPGTPDDFNGTVFVVDQNEGGTRTFDEHKVILGAADMEEAKQLYRENYAKDWDGLGAISAVPMKEFKQWLQSGETTKPFHRKENTYRTPDAAKPDQPAAMVPAKDDRSAAILKYWDSLSHAERQKWRSLSLKSELSAPELAYTNQLPAPAKEEEQPAAFPVPAKDEAKPALPAPAKSFKGMRASVIDAEKAFAAATTKEEQQGHIDRLAQMRKDFVSSPGHLTSEQYYNVLRMFDNALSKMNQSVEATPPKTGATPPPADTPTGPVELDYTPKPGQKPKRPTAKQIVADWKKAGWPTEFSVTYGETEATFRYGDMHGRRGWIDEGNGARGFSRGEILEALGDFIPAEEQRKRPTPKGDLVVKPVFGGPESVIPAKEPDAPAPMPTDRPVSQDEPSTARPSLRELYDAGLEGKRSPIPVEERTPDEIRAYDAGLEGKQFPPDLRDEEAPEGEYPSPAELAQAKAPDAAALPVPPAETSTPEEEETKAQVARDAPLNPKVAPLVRALNKAGIGTTLSGDAYGDRLVYVDIRPSDMKKLDPARLPPGWKQVVSSMPSLNHELLGFDLHPDHKLQDEHIAETDGKNRLGKVGTSISQEEVRQIVEAFSGKPKAIDSAAAPTPVDPQAEEPAPLPADVPDTELQTYATAGKAVANYVAARLAEKGTAPGVLAFSDRELFERANYDFGGTQAEGKYTPKDAYDAMELGINKYIRDGEGMSPTDPVGFNAQADMRALRDNILEKIPTQTRRTEEQVEFQQFSTPPDLAYLMSWAANVSNRDTVLEPSAGLGGLAVFAKNAGATVVMNEYNQRRAALLRTLNLGQVFTENAEQLHNILPKDVQPTVVIMNPPFSSTAGRIQGQRKTTNGLVHLEQALKRLQPGGRLVALIGKGKVFKDPLVLERWIADRAKEYAYRARIGLSGKGYKKYGTVYDNQILIFDKITPDGRPPVIETVDDVLQAVPLLKEVRDVRQSAPAGSRPAEQPTPQPARPEAPAPSEAGPGPESAVLPPADAVGADERQGEAPDTGLDRPRPGNRRPAPGERAGGSDAVPDRQPRRPAKPAPATPSPAPRDEPEGSGDRPPERPGSETGGGSERGGLPAEQVPQKLEIEQGEKRKRPAKELGDSIYEEYVPAKFKVKGAKPHPGKLAESAALAAVEGPELTYRPHLPQHLIERGTPSLAQLEAVALAGQAHETMLPNGQRKGVFVGDGPGVGKGLTIASIIMDNWNQGRKKAVWLSETQNLYDSAIRDWTALEGRPQDLYVINKFKTGLPLPPTQGLMFMTYSTMGTGIEVTRSGEMRNKQVKGGKPEERVKTRLDQLSEWLGENYDGVIVFDEAHNMQNALGEEGEEGRMGRPASARALAGVELQRRFPNARIVYSSATGATKLAALAYAERLGLWGEGTGFPAKSDFLSEIGGAGLGAMEIVAQNLKANGAYISRNLSYDGISYDKIEHELTDDQREMYNTAGQAWQVVLRDINKALELTGITTTSGRLRNRAAKAAAMGKFWGTQLRFYNQLLNGLQMPSVLKDMERRLEAGETAVIQLTKTNEAGLDRELSKLSQDEDANLGALDVSPKQDLIEYVRNSFPVQQFEEYMDADGNIRTRPVNDSTGKPVENAEAVQLREELIGRLQDLRIPDGPLDQIINKFGPDRVAEITGREVRVLRHTTRDGKIIERIEKRTDALRKKEVKEFLDDKRDILVFSEKGGTGESYHADLTKKNTRMRNHYLVEPGWRADKAVQGLGRTHRTNQKQPPRYILTMTNIKGHKRFLSTIARRLDQLGALTKGQRQAGSSGLLDAKDNLENEYARRAIEQLIRDIVQGVVPDLTVNTLTQELGLDRLLDPRDGRLNVDAIPDVPKFMNRLLALDIAKQNHMFDEFARRMETMVEIAAARGELDTGMETYRASGGVRTVSNDVIFRLPNGGATVNLVTLEATHNTEFNAFDDSINQRFAKNKRTGRVWGVLDLGNRTQDDGSVVHTYRLNGHQAGRYQYVNEEALDDNYEIIKKPEAKKLWDAQIAAEPQTFTEQFAIVTGSILNIWTKMGDYKRIMRAQTVDGEVYIGVHRTPQMAEALKVQLGVAAEMKPPTLTPAQYSEQILDKGATLTLDNGWTIRRSRVAGETRMEVQAENIGKHRDELTRAGVFSEIIGSMRRYFIPTGERGPGILAAILQAHPITRFLESAKQALGNERGSVPLSQLVPGRRPTDDSLQGLPEGGLTFDDPNTEARFQVAKQGLGREGFRTRLQNGIREVVRMTREFPDLPDTPGYSPLRTALLQLQKQRGIAAERTIRQLRTIVSDMGPQRLDLFTRKVILDDLAGEARLGRELPFGLDADAVERNLQQVDDVLAQNPDVVDALRRRTEAWADVKRRYQSAMRAIGQDRLADRLNKSAYFRHQILEYARERGRDPKGTGKELKSPTGRGFLKRRQGSAKDINANYLQADFEVMAQMEHDIQVAKTVRLVDQQYNIRPQLERQARRQNDQAIQRIIAQERATLDLPEEVPTPTEERLKAFAKTIAMGLDRVRRAMDIPRRGIITFDQLQSWAEDPESPAHAGALQAFKGISERRKFVRELLGRDFKTWEDVIPEGYQIWQPEQGNVFYLADSIPAQLAKQLTEALIPSLNLTAEQLRKVLAMGGPKEQFVVDQNVYDTLRNMARPIPQWWQSVIRSAQGHMKQLFLLAPRRAIRYNLRNLTGDADAVFAGNPKAFRQLGRAMSDLWPAFFGKMTNLQGEAKEWFDRGGFQTTMQVQEMGDLNELKLFRALLERDHQGGLLSVPAKVLNKYWQTARLATDYREALLRYANYLEYLGQMQRNNGRPDNFGASIRENVMALADPRDRAFKLANELMGAYDRVSVAGQALRNYWYPFFSWVEVNFRRYKQLFKNAFKDLSAAGLSRLGFVGARKALKWMIRFMALWTMLQVWNNLMFPDDERELDETTRSKPHILFGRDDKGRIMYLSGLGALGDLLGWFGLDEAPAMTQDVMHGRLTPGEAIERVVKAPVNKFVQGITAFVKVPGELLARQSLYPDVFRPRPIQDRMEHVANALTVGPEYRALTGKPGRSYLGAEDLTGLIVQRQDPGAAAYGDWQKIEEKWLNRFGRSKGIYFRGPKSDAIRNISRAIQEGDTKAEARWREKFEQLGGTKKDLEKSIRALAPLSGMSRAQRDTVLESLDSEERAILKRAERYFEEKMMQALPEDRQIGLKRRLRKQGWLTPEEPAVADFPLE